MNIAGRKRRDETILADVRDRRKSEASLRIVRVVANTPWNLSYADIPCES